MSREWFKTMGFRNNPFHIEPELKDDFFGNEALLYELFYRIDAGTIVFVEGKSGKTSLLNKVIQKYRGKGRVAYVDCQKVGEEPDMKKLLLNKKSTKPDLNKKSDKVSRLRKGMIVLLDNISYLSQKNAQRMKYYFDQGNIHSIVMTATDFSEAKIPASIRHRIGKRVYKIRDLTKDEMVDIVQERLNFSDLFKQKYIKMITDKKNNIKDIFKECEATIFVMQNLGKVEIDQHIIYKILYDKNEMN